MALQNALVINKGSDATFGVQWYADDSEEAPVLNLTGYTAEIYDAHTLLVGHIAVSIPSPTTGQTPVTITWQDDMPMGAVMSFRIRIANGPRLSTEKMMVVVE